MQKKKKSKHWKHIQPCQQQKYYRTDLHGLAYTNPLGGQVLKL